MTTTPPFDPSPTPTETDGRSRSSRPILLGAGAVVIVAMVAAGVVLATRSDEDASACLAGLLEHVPSDATFVDGGDMEAARAAGYDDSTVDAYIDSALATGVSPDPLTRAVIARHFRDVDMADAPFDPADVECWVGEAGEFVARGTFDADRAAAATLAEVELSDEADLAAPDRALLEPTTPPAGLEEAFDSMAVPGLASFTLISSPAEDDSEWIGLGLVAGDGDDGPWELRVVWSFDDEANADTAEERLGDILEDESVIVDMVDGDPVELLERSGAILTMQAPMTEDPTRWMLPLQRFDPMFLLDPLGS